MTIWNWLYFVQLVLSAAGWVVYGTIATEKERATVERIFANVFAIADVRQPHGFFYFVFVGIPRYLLFLVALIAVLWGGGEAAMIYAWCSRNKRQKQELQSLSS